MASNKAKLTFSSLFVVLVGGFVFLNSKKDSKSKVPFVEGVEATEVRSNTKPLFESRPPGRSKDKKKKKEKGQETLSPEGFLQASQDCFGREFDDGASFYQILQEAGLLNKENSVLRKNKIYEVGGKEVRVTFSQASGTEEWEGKVFDVDKEGYPIIRESQSAPGLDSIVDIYRKKFAGALEIQKEEFLGVQNGSSQSGTILLVNDVPVEVRIKVLEPGEDGRHLECAAGKCHCYGMADE